MSTPPPIPTLRLDLIPMTPAFLRASLAGDIAGAATLLAAELPSEWPDIPNVLEMRLAQLEADPTLQPWLLRGMVLRETGEMVGYIGFHTAPGADYLEEWSPGAVEFGFSVFPAHQRLGYALEAAEALMQWTKDAHHIEKFVLTIRPDNHASQALAQRLGFVRIGEHVDGVDGVEEVFTR